MKTVDKLIKYTLLLGSLILAPVFLMDASAQGESENVEKPVTRMSMNYININNYSPRLRTIVRGRIDDVFQPIEGVRINYYYIENDEEKSIGFAMTDHKGEVSYILPDIFYHALDTTDYFYFIARIEDDPKASDAEAETEVYRSRITMEMMIEDSVKKVQIQVERAGEEAHEYIPEPDVEIGLFVNRLFGLLPIATGEYTDEDGIVTIEIPDDIPGDEQGMISIYARVEEHEEFGTLIATKEENWGTVKVDHNPTEARELWSTGANAPISLVATVSILVIGIWSVVGFLIYEIFKIKKSASSV